MNEHTIRPLEEIRRDLDEVDRAIVRLYEQRMQLCRQVAETKMAIGMPVLDQSREEQVLQNRADLVSDEALRDGVIELYRTLMAVSRAEQKRMMEEAGIHA